MKTFKNKKLANKLLYPILGLMVAMVVPVAVTIMLLIGIFFAVIITHMEIKWVEKS